MSAFHFPLVCAKIPSCNKGRIVDQKRPLQPKHVWAIRVRLEIASYIHDLSRVAMAIGCMLRGCDLVRLKVCDVFVSGHMKERAFVVQAETQRPVPFEITEATRKSVQRRIEIPAMFGCDDLWPSRFPYSAHLSTRQCARNLQGWITSIGRAPRDSGIHAMRRTKAPQIYKETENQQAEQLLPGHAKMDSTMRHLGVERKNALTIVEMMNDTLTTPSSPQLIAAKSGARRTSSGATETSGDESSAIKTDTVIWVKARTQALTMALHRCRGSWHDDCAEHQRPCQRSSAAYPRIMPKADTTLIGSDPRVMPGFGPRRRCSGDQPQAERPVMRGQLWCRSSMTRG